MSELKDKAGFASDKTGIYIHIPYCRHKCAYCSFVSDSDFSDMRLYVDALINEIRERGGGEADTVYIGGGTPSVLYGGAITRILQAIRQSFTLSENVEITVECNPDSVSDGFFGECAACGVNRISMGLQSADNSLLKKINRPHTAEQFFDALASAQRCGINNFSADLMIGLPEQSIESALNSVKSVAIAGVNHVSLYALTVEEGTPLYESGYLPDEDLAAEAYGKCYEILKKLGFKRYEVSNFCKDGKVSRHNLKYWTGAPYVGFGVAAHSYDGDFRYANTTNRAKYVIGDRRQSVIELTKEDKIEERIMLSLRTENGLDLKDFKCRFGYDLVENKRAQIDKLSALSLIEIEDGRLRLKEDAYYLMNSVIVSLI